MTRNRHDRDREFVEHTSQALRPQNPAAQVPGLKPLDKALSPKQGPTVFHQAKSAVRGLAQAAQARLADIRIRLLAIGREMASWIVQAAKAREAEEEALKGIESLASARTAMAVAHECRARVSQVVLEKAKAMGVAELNQRKSAEAASGIAAVAKARNSLEVSVKTTSAAAVVRERAAEARKELRASMTEEQWAIHRKERAAERRAEAKAKRDAVAAAATPSADKRRRSTREQVRQERLEGKKGKSKRKDKKKDLPSYRKVAERDARHDEVYRSAIKTSFQEELDIVQGQSWRFPPEAVVEFTQTSKHHRIIGRSPLLEGVEPTPEAIARAMDEFAAKQSPSTKQKPVREGIISHKDGVAVTDEWFVYQACRHLAAMGVPPSSVAWILTLHTEHDHQHAHLIWVPVEEDGTAYVCKYAVVASALETGRQDAWADIPVGRLRAPTSKFKDTRNGYFVAAKGKLITVQHSPDGVTTNILLQGPEAAKFRLEMAGAPFDQHGHTGGTFTHKKSGYTALGAVHHSLTEQKE